MGYKLLLAEDSAAIQQVVQLAFNGEDVDVVVVDDGHAAITAIERESPDIVLADASLPGTNGYDLAARIGGHEAAESKLPVVLLAGAFEPVDRERASAAGCRGILVKPFVPRDLVTRVMTLLDPAYREPPPEPDVPEAATPEPASRPEPMRVEPQPEPVAVEPESASVEPERTEPRPIDVTPLREPAPVAAAPEPEPIVVTPAPEPVEVASPPAPTSIAHRPILAQAFATFLSAERELAPQSDGAVTSIPSPGAPPSDLGDGVKRELHRRVRRRLTKGFVRNMAEQVVVKAVDRILREELARMNVRPPSAE